MELNQLKTGQLFKSEPYLWKFRENDLGPFLASLAPWFQSV